MTPLRQRLDTTHEVNDSLRQQLIATPASDTSFRTKVAALGHECASHIAATSILKAVDEKYAFLYETLDVMHKENVSLYQKVAAHSRECASQFATRDLLDAATQECTSLHQKLDDASKDNASLREEITALHAGNAQSTSLYQKFDIVSKENVSLRREIAIAHHNIALLAKTEACLITANTSLSTRLEAAEATCSASSKDDQREHGMLDIGGFLCRLYTDQACRRRQ